MLQVNLNITKLACEIRLHNFDFITCINFAEIDQVRQGSVRFGEIRGDSDQVLTCRAIELQRVVESRVIKPQTAVELQRTERAAELQKA